MAAFPISVQNPSPVFGLPVTLCRLCPQYAHKIIFSKKCYNERKCPLPAVLVFIHRKTRAGKAVKRVRSTVEGPNQYLADSGKMDRREREVDLCNVGCFKREAGIPTAPDSHHNADESFHHGERTVNTLNKPKISHILASHFLRRLSSTNFFKRFLAWAWKIRLERLKTREMTCFGWRKKQ